jgi:hypothetical protein
VFSPLLRFCEATRPRRDCTTHSPWR